jgi:hypothetical protein
VCGACPWAYAEEFFLPWDYKFILQAFLGKKTLGSGQKKFQFQHF